MMADGVVMERLGGNAARRTAVAAAGECAARRSGQGVGETRTSRSCATPTTATSTCGRGGRASGSWRRCERMYAKLRLRINEAKSAVARTARPQVPGLQLLVRQGRRGHTPVAPEGPWGDEGASAADHQISNGGRSMSRWSRNCGSYLPGWKQYFRLADTPSVFARPRRMASPPAASDATQAVEARYDDLSRAA